MVEASAGTRPRVERSDYLPLFARSRAPEPGADLLKCDLGRGHCRSGAAGDVITFQNTKSVHTAVRIPGIGTYCHQDTRYRHILSSGYQVSVLVPTRSSKAEPSCTWNCRRCVDADALVRVPHAVQHLSDTLALALFWRGRGGPCFPCFHNICFQAELSDAFGKPGVGCLGSFD